MKSIVIISSRSRVKSNLATELTSQASVSFLKLADFLELAIDDLRAFDLFVFDITKQNYNESMLAMKALQKYKLCNFLLLAKNLNTVEKHIFLSYNPCLFLEANQLNPLVIYNVNSFIANFSVLNNSKNQALVGDIPNYILKVIHYIEENITQRISTEKIANHVGYTRPHLSREFKRIMNMTLKDYIVQNKIEYVLNYIKGKECKEVDFAELSQKIGMSSYTTFAKNFKKYTKQNPHDYLMYENSLG